ncbi:ribonuclease E/G [Miniphocaeibacter halophilus]|uniref:Ribonuclease E/G n=1 Tax=Miniphocaeibacter halophilus TaxID=2931922 RepID=A0AC61MRF7_9FIRM|nr:ribonuclease E/G [Miniphocaeibacter halophilus]QQK07155.1 ribonuclease E/G [Miniphocaeibacter halophilus]
MNYYFVYKNKNIITIGYIVNNKLEVLENIDIDERDSIYIAKIIKNIESINGFIIEIEKGVEACIGKGQIRGDKFLGDEILVQLYKKTGDNKFDKYTMDYSIAGQNIVYYPNREKNKYSRKINRKDLINFKKKIDSTAKFKGITFRTNSINISEEELLKEYKSLLKVDEYIKKQSKFLPIPRKLYSNPKSVFELISEEFEYIVTNNKEIKNILKNYYNTENVIYNEEYDYKYDENITEDLINLNSKKIIIKDNANIIVEKTEALTVIDVNSGRNEDFLEINKLAIKEALRQINLRNIQGIIVVDIININKKEFKVLNNFILREIKKYSKIKYFGITKTGLLEFIRTGINIDF